MQGIDGKAIQDGMASVAGGIDGALDAALSGTGVTSDGRVPDGFPTADVPLVDGTVLGRRGRTERHRLGGAGPRGTVDDFQAAAEQLAAAGYTESAKRADASSAFGVVPQ